MKFNDLTMNKNDQLIYEIIAKSFAIFNIVDDCIVLADKKLYTISSIYAMIII